MITKIKSNSLKILVVDDYDEFRSDYIEYLNNQNGFYVVGEAKDGFEAFKKIEKLKPDIIFMDISMPKMDGFSSANLIKKKYPEIKIIIVSIYEKSIFEEIGSKIPVDGFITKSSISLELPKILKELDSAPAI